MGLMYILKKIIHVQNLIKNEYHLFLVPHAKLRYQEEEGPTYIFLYRPLEVLEYIIPLK